MEEEIFFCGFYGEGFHIYKDVWNPVVGDILMCQREFGKLHDPYAVTVVRDHVIEKLFFAEIFLSKSTYSPRKKSTLRYAILEAY